MVLNDDPPEPVRDVLEASAALDITEFHLFELAYRHWHGHPAETRLIERHFTAYMFEDVVPPWVRHFCRGILQAANDGTLSPANYGIEGERITDRQRRRGRLFFLSLLVVLLILLWLTLMDRDLLGIARNCYFPPCF